jgi:hypothetical protein
MFYGLGLALSNSFAHVTQFSIELLDVVKRARYLSFFGLVDIQGHGLDTDHACIHLRSALCLTTLLSTVSHILFDILRNALFAERLLLVDEHYYRFGEVLLAQITTSLHLVLAELRHRHWHRWHLAPVEISWGHLLSQFILRLSSLVLIESLRLFWLVHHSLTSSIRLRLIIRCSKVVIRRLLILLVFSISIIVVALPVILGLLVSTLLLELFAALLLLETSLIVVLVAAAVVVLIVRVLSTSLRSLLSLGCLQENILTVLLAQHLKQVFQF